MVEYVPEPTIIMFGCQSLSNYLATPADCPVCKGGIRKGHDTRHCGVCDSSSPAIEAMVKAARLGDGIRERAEKRDEAYRDRIDGGSGDVLPESDRRRIWNGHGRIHSEDQEPTNRARIGRDWLKSIGQEPDWSLVRDVIHGRWVKIP